MNLPQTEGSIIDFMTTDEAAARLGVTTRRVVQLLRQGALGGEQVHRTWLVSVVSVAEREVVGSARGRPLRSDTARTLVDALSSGRDLPTRHARLLQSRSAEDVARLIAPTGASSPSRLDAPPWSGRRSR